MVAGLLCLARLFGLVLWFFAVGVNDLVHAVLEELSTSGWLSI